MRHVVEERIPITTDEDLDALLVQLEPALNMRETEHSWEYIDAALARFQAATRGGAHKVPSYVSAVRGIAGVITTSLLSERTRLSGTASDVINSMAPALETDSPRSCHCLCRHCSRSAHGQTRWP